MNALDLHPGDAVLELRCGTGLNFALLEQKISPEGKIIGVDATDAMLEQARRRVDQKSGAMSSSPTKTPLCLRFQAGSTP